MAHCKSKRHVSLRAKLMWGVGGLADNFMFNTMTALGTMVYVNHFKLTPALAGYVHQRAHRQQGHAAAPGGPARAGDNPFRHNRCR
jgi:hypothetical protein